MGKKLNRVEENLRELMKEAMDKSYMRGTEYDQGYAQGMFEAMYLIQSEQQGKRRRFKR